ncbi:MAG: restriction endonuclease subunit S [Sandaracinaceae bacterium]
MATGPFGSAISSRFFVDSGVPVIRGSNLSDDTGVRISDANLVYIPDDLARKFSRSEVRLGDLVFTCWGTIGQVGLIDQRAGYDRYIVSNKQMKLTPDATVADSLFLYYVYSSPQVVERIQGQKIGSSVPGFNLGQLKAITIPVPPLEEQRRIAGVLGALDDRIELNRKMNRTLEEMAQAIFKSWFIDFDGVPHSEMVDSELGPIPGAVKLVYLGDILSDLETGKRPKGGVKQIASGVPSIGAESIVGVGRYDFAKTKYVPEEFFVKMKKGVLRDRDVLVYKDGGKPGDFRPHVSMFGDGFPFNRAAINSHVYRLRADGRVSQEYLYFWLASDSMLALMRRMGTGAAIPGIPKRNLVRIPVVLPERGRVERFQEYAEPAVSRIFANANQSRTLEELRDALLPKLISGEIRVPEAEKAVEAVL